MIPWTLTPDRLVRRYKRFLADTESGLTLHCPNTGAMTGLLEPGAEIGYEPKEGGKTAGRWVLVKVADDWVCLDSQRANGWVKAGIDTWFPNYTWRAEQTVDNARFDFCGSGEFWLEVKGVTLLHDGRGAFPDAKSERAVKHLNGLSALAKSGQRAALLYVIMHNGINDVVSADWVDPAYAAARVAAVKSGVEVWQVKADVSWDGVEMGAPLRVE